MIRNCSLRGDPARKLAEQAVSAAAPKIRAEYAARLAGVSDREGMVVGAGILAALVLDLFVISQVVRCGSRTTRTVACTAAATRVALSVYAKRRDQRLRAAARLEKAGAR